MRQRILNDLRRRTRRKRSNQDLKVGDLVMEITPSHAPLQTGVRGPFLIVELNAAKTHAILETGRTNFKQARRFSRHTSHLVLFKEAS
jgi:hypothetical protein